jgi:sugar phosphate isomerase/epimerase
MNRRTFLRAAAGLALPAVVRLAHSFQQASSAPRFSLAHLTVLGCSPPEMTRIAARAGYDFVSYRLIQMGLANERDYSLAHNPAMLRETKSALADTGLKLHDIELARIVDGVDIAAYLPELEVAAQLGARRVISSVWTANRTYAIDSLGRLCGIAGKLGLQVSLEFVTWSNAPRLRDAVGLMGAVRQPNCGLLIDTLHFHRSRVRLEELDEVPSERFHFVHLCDAPREIPATAGELIRTGREARLDPGEGGIDLAAIISRLPRVPYSLEIPNLDRVKRIGYEAHARLCLEHARGYLLGRLAFAEGMVPPPQPASPGRVG